MNRRMLLGSISAMSLLRVARPIRAAEQTPLRLAAPPTDSSALYFYAEQLGAFKKAGLPAEVSMLANGEAVTQGVIGGSVDIGNGQAITLVVAFAKGIPLTVLAGSGINTASSQAGSSGAFFVPKNSTATTGKDLIGKTIGVQGLKGFAQYGTMAWLDKTGGDSSSNKFVEMSSSVMGAALNEGRLDGAFIPEPNVSYVAKYAKKVAYPMDGIAPSFYSGTHFATLAWARAHADQIKRFEALMYETGAWANKHHEQSAELLSNAVHLDLAVVKASVRIEYATRRDPALLQPMIDLAVKYGGITPFRAEEIFFKA